MQLRSTQQFTVITPCNDGESKKIIEICHYLNIELRISNQKWGARLDKESDSFLSSLKKNVVIVEMPGPEVESKLVEHCHRLFILDHHLYKFENQVIDRRNSLSSLEQFAELFGYKLNRFEMGIALNDRGYIWLLRKEGYSEEEILKIRKYDLEAQGLVQEDFDKSEIEYSTGYKIARKNTYLVITSLERVSYIADIHQLKEGHKQNLLIVNMKDKEANFFGIPEICKSLFSKYNGWLGGDESFSMFWGIKGDLPEIYDILVEGEAFISLEKNIHNFS